MGSSGCAVNGSSPKRTRNTTGRDPIPSRRSGTGPWPMAWKGARDSGRRDSAARGDLAGRLRSGPRPRARPPAARGRRLPERVQRGPGRAPRRLPGNDEGAEDPFPCADRAAGRRAPRRQLRALRPAPHRLDRSTDLPARGRRGPPRLRPSTTACGSSSISDGAIACRPRCRRSVARVATTVSGSGDVRRIRAGLNGAPPRRSAARACQPGR